MNKEKLERVAKAIWKINNSVGNEFDKYAHLQPRWEDYIEEAKAAISACEEWLPIESAPKDEWCLIDVSGEVVRAIKKGGITEPEYWWPHTSSGEVPRHTWSNEFVIGWVPLPIPQK